MENLDANSLRIEVSDRDDHVHMKLFGSSEDREPSKILTPYFTKIVDEMDKSLVVDFSELEYMNSSTVGPILNLIKMLNSKAIQTTLLYDKSLAWQKSAFNGIVMICRKMEYVDVSSI